MGKDIVTGQDITIDHSVHKVYDGQMFLSSQYLTIAAAGVAEVYLKTRSAYTTYCNVEVVTSGQALVKLIEGITTSVAGTSITTVCMFRSKTDSCGAHGFYAPTWSTNTEVTLVTDITGVGNKVSSDFSVGENKLWAMDGDTKYLVQVTNQAGATITTSINFNFYETAD